MNRQKPTFETLEDRWLFDGTGFAPAPISIYGDPIVTFADVQHALDDLKDDTDTPAKKESPDEQKPDETAPVDEKRPENDSPKTRREELHPHEYDWTCFGADIHDFEFESAFQKLSDWWDDVMEEGWKIVPGPDRSPPNVGTGPGISLGDAPQKGGTKPFPLSGAFGMGCPMPWPSHEAP